MCALVIRAGFVGSCVLQEDSLQYKGFDWSLLKSEHCFGLFWSLSKCIIYNAVTWMCIFLVCELVVIIIINPLTVRVVGAPQIILQPIFSIFPCSPRPSGTCQLQACPFPDVVFPPLPLSALSSGHQVMWESEVKAESWSLALTWLTAEYCRYLN